MMRISAALAVAALAVAAAPAAADPGAPGTTFPKQPSSHSSPHEWEADGTMAIVLGGVLCSW
jgi:hypothetical protein